MAADTRPYKSKEQDGQGNEVIIRDQQLVEQSTVTTMPSGACFETLDIDGRPVKIPRDNMMSIVLECIGIVLNDSSKNLGTNVNKALGLQGNTIGNVTVNDFASVLGVIKIESGSTIAALTTNTITYCGTDINGVTYFGNALVLKDSAGMRITQLFFAPEIAAYRTKTKDQANFPAWKVISAT